MMQEIRNPTCGYTIYLILKINLKINPVNPRTCYDVRVAYQGFRLLEVSRDSLVRSVKPIGKIEVIGSRLLGFDLDFPNDSIDSAGIGAIALCLIFFLISLFLSLFLFFNVREREK